MQFVRGFKPALDYSCSGLSASLSDLSSAFAFLPLLDLSDFSSPLEVALRLALDPLASLSLVVVELLLLAAGDDFVEVPVAELPLFPVPLLVAGVLVADAPLAELPVDECPLVLLLVAAEADGEALVAGLVLAAGVVRAAADEADELAFGVALALAEGEAETLGEALALGDAVAAALGEAAVAGLGEAAVEDAPLCPE